MPRVVLFFDGKNHMKDLRMAAEDRWIDHSALARWVVEQVGGTELVAAHYYTGVPNAADDGGRGALTDLLAELERRPGFFVHRYQRQQASFACSACGHDEVFTREKQVDTALVADMIVMAARDIYDIAVVFSGDLDFAPALDAVHGFGKKGWIATFGQVGINRGLHRAAWGSIDLHGHIDGFACALPEAIRAAGRDPTLNDAEVLRELSRAQGHFVGGGGFVGTQYFMHRWRGQGIPEDPEIRRQAVERLMQAGFVESYDAGGRSALRVVGSRLDEGGEAPPPALLDEPEGGMSISEP